MKARVTIDKRGRVVLPKPLRDELGLRAGDALDAEISGDEFTLRPIRTRARMWKENGLSVFSFGDDPISVDVQEAIDQIREERDRANFFTS